MRFTWDPRKDAINRPKHEVDFRLAATVFADPLSWTYPDPEHSHGEERYVTIGASKRGAILVVTHHDLGDSIRIISARRATRSERMFYEEG